jgi:LacI family transcriptional regulator
MGYAGKQMNTVKQDFVKISEEALVELDRLMSGEKGRKVVIPHTLVRIKYEDIIR